MGKKDDKKGGKKGGGKELTEEEMRRMGMPEEQIQMVLGQRGMSSEDKKKQTEEEEKRKHAAAAKQKYDKLIADLVATAEHEMELTQVVEDREREALKEQEVKAAEPLLKKMEIELKRQRIHLEAAAAKERAEKQRQAFLDHLASMTAEERESYNKMSQEAQAKEQARIEKAFLEQQEKDAAERKKAEEEAKKREKREAAQQRTQEFLQDLQAKGITVGDGFDQRDGVSLDVADSVEDQFLAANAKRLS